MVKILRGGISWEKIKRWVLEKIRIEGTNTFVGIDAGLKTTGDSNNFMGYRAGYLNTTGYYNNFMGYKTGYSNTTADYNNFMGYLAGYSNTTGHSNNFMGYQAGLSNTTGHSNNFMGCKAGYSNTTSGSNCFIGSNAGYETISGGGNTFIGTAAGYANITGYNNVFIGYEAARYETGSNKLFIDNQARTNEADGRIKALIYGVFDAATANQRLSINGRVLIKEVATYANDAAAGTGGLVTGEIYKHADGSLHIKL